LIFNKRSSTSEEVEGGIVLVEALLQKQKKMKMGM
jgi:hypothetical protein